MDPGRHLELLPHYVGVVALTVAAIATTRATTGGLGFPAELGIAVAVVLLYPSLVRFLDLAPDAWEER